MGAGEAFEAREISVELLRRETVSREAGNAAESVQRRRTVARGVRLGPGAARGYGFSIDVPESVECPTSRAPHARVGWYLRGVAADPSGRGAAPEVEVHIRNGPAWSG